MLTLGVLLVAPAAHAAPAAPEMDRTVELVDYYSGVMITGHKELATTIELEMADGRTPACDGGGDLVFSGFTCLIDKDLLWPRTALDPMEEVVKVYAVDALGDRSPASLVTLRLSESRFEITSPDKLPSGDVITLEGEREYGTTIQWLLEGDTGMVFRDQTCTLPEDVEDRSFSCTYDTTGAATRSAKALAMVVPDGAYEATFTELQGAVIIDQISFLFTVGGAPPPPVTPPVTPPDPGDPPGPADPPDPTTPPMTGGGGGGGGDGGGGPGPTTPTPSTPTDGAVETPSIEPSVSAESSEASSDGPTLTPVEPEDDLAAPPAAVPDIDILPWLILAVLAFTILGTLGMPGLQLGGRFAPGSTRTGGGQVPVGRWPQADEAASGAGLHRSGNAGLIGLAAGEVGAADEAVEVEGRVTEGWGDRSVTWRAPGHELTDELGASLPVRLAPRWPLLARLVDDGTPARAVLGSLSLLLPAAGLVLGVLGALEADGPFAPCPLAQRSAARDRPRRRAGRCRRRRRLLGRRRPQRRPDRGRADPRAGLARAGRRRRPLVHGPAGRRGRPAVPPGPGRRPGLCLGPRRRHGDRGPAVRAGRSRGSSAAWTTWSAGPSR